jgi:hypothetical protein
VVGCGDDGGDHDDVGDQVTQSSQLPLSMLYWSPTGEAPGASVEVRR